MRGVSEAMMSSRVMKDVAKCRINSIACGIMYGEPRERMTSTGPPLVTLRLPFTVSFLPALLDSHRDSPNKRAAALTVHLLRSRKRRLGTVSGVPPPIS